VTEQAPCGADTPRSVDAKRLDSAWRELLAECDGMEETFGPECSELRQLPTADIRAIARKWGVSE
jgi:hypothetical protein